MKWSKKPTRNAVVVRLGGELTSYADWVGLFGKSTFNPAVRQRLADAGITGLPKIPRDEIFTLEGVGDGLVVNFTDSEVFTHLAEPVGDGTPIVAAVTMFLVNPGDTPYRGPLPFGLRFSDGRETLRGRFGEPQDGDDDIPSDEWTIEGLVLRVFYTADFGALQRVRLTLPEAN